MTKSPKMAAAAIPIMAGVPIPEDELEPSEVSPLPVVPESDGAAVSVTPAFCRTVAAYCWLEEYGPLLASAPGPWL